MRGKAVPKADKLEQIRITPAYAGKRVLSYLLGSFNRDHPRLCGEKDNSVGI